MGWAIARPEGPVGTALAEGLNVLLELAELNPEGTIDTDIRFEST